MRSVSEIFASSEGVNFLGMIGEGEPDEEPSGESPSNIGGDHGYEAIEPPLGSHYDGGSDGEVIWVTCSSDEGDEAQQYHDNMMRGLPEFAFPEASNEEIEEYLRSIGSNANPAALSAQSQVRAQSVLQLSSEPQLGRSLKPR